MPKKSTKKKTAEQKGSGSDSDSDGPHHSKTRSQLTLYDRQMIKLTADNFYKFNQALITVQYFAEWDPSIINIEQEATPPGMVSRRMMQRQKRLDVQPMHYYA